MSPRSAMRALNVAAFVAALALPVSLLRAQSATPEGTVITNTATATYADDNGNTYAATPVSVSIKVGFVAGVDVQASTPTQASASPSTGNQAVFTLSNVGNGPDTLIVSGVSEPQGISITGYILDGTTYTDLSNLVAALRTKKVDQNSSVSITVVYDVAAGQGGKSLPIQLIGKSVRDASVTDKVIMLVEPPLSVAVELTPSSETVSRLRSNGTNYSHTLTITNEGNAKDVFDLSVGAVDAGLTIVSVNGVAGTNGGALTLESGETKTFTVVYTVDATATMGSTLSFTVSAVSHADAAVKADAILNVNVLGANISLAKAAFRDDRATPIGVGDKVLPGDYIQYKITVTSDADAEDASSITVTDALPAEVIFDSATGDAAGWTLSESGGTVTAVLSGKLSAGESRFFWVRVRIK